MNSEAAAAFIAAVVKHEVGKQHIILQDPAFSGIWYHCSNLDTKMKRKSRALKSQASKSLVSYGRRQSSMSLLGGRPKASPTGDEYLIEMAIKAEIDLEVEEIRRMPAEEAAAAAAQAVVEAGIAIAIAERAEREAAEAEAAAAAAQAFAEEVMKELMKFRNKCTKDGGSSSGICKKYRSAKMG